MKKFVISTMINCNPYPVMNVVMTDDIHKVMDGDGHPTDKMMEILIYKRPYIEVFIKNYDLKKTDIYCNYLCIDNDCIPSPHKVD